MVMLGPVEREITVPALARWMLSLGHLRDTRRVEISLFGDDA